jgi:GNAT superfamily N-acetyltransferase
MSFIIRPLRPNEAELYREIRLEALRLHPTSLSAAFEQEAARPMDHFVERLTGNVIFGGFRNGALLGCVGFQREAGQKRTHKGHLWGMYVRAPARGTGLARLLVDAVIEHARTEVEVLLLSVVATSVAAHRLYLSCGFEPFGVEPRALRVDGQDYDEIHMMRILA